MDKKDRAGKRAEEREIAIPGMQIRDKIDAQIYEVGKSLIDTPFFQKSKMQTHHKKTTLYMHIMGVTRRAVKLCDLCEQKGKHVDKKSVIIAALCHDIGMIGRDRRYKNDFQAWNLHPRLSERLTRKYFPDANEATMKIIHKHMWPLTVRVPTTREEWIVVQADKVASWDDIRSRKN